MHRKHTVNVFRDLPDLNYRMLSQVKTMEERQEAEIQRMKERELSPEAAHHLMVAAVRKRVLPASKLPKVIAAWDQPQYPEFAARRAWSLFNAFTEVMKTRSPRAQMEGSLKLHRLFSE